LTNSYHLHLFSSTNRLTVSIDLIRLDVLGNGISITQTVVL
jgi:hypothetical protein